ncbi:MAG: AbrB family transcriptional regulator [Phreatobacter sp.]|uniref:AbrB family transcriptional regulator n=1 Tax=Phreatobacter sp. TaxID=1966341 RepID=UPI002734C37C|nr:AbrB family transcriptional regulator [Phreatobacter sp.]MDP2800927.1 AbrB family transcriptional regulator [Phreatobacter sp.]
MPRIAPIVDFLKSFVLPCLIGAGGGYAFDRLGMPAAWLSGSLVAATLLALGGAKVVVPGPIATATFLLLGTIMGAAVTPETLRLMLSWPVSMAGLAVLVPAIVLAITVYLVRIERFDRETAFFASIPGALSYVMAMTLTSRADVRRVAVIQSFRLVLLVAALPGLLSLARIGGTPVPAPATAGLGPWPELLLLLVLSASCGLGMERLKVPGGATVGAMLASAVLHATGLVTALVPEPVMIVGFVVIGVLIAARFAGTSLAELRQLLRASVGAFLAGIAVTLVVAAAVAWITGLPLGKVILAYAPGGIEAMAVLAFVLDMDPAFVGAHHIVRFVGIALLLPLAARIVLGPQRAATDLSIPPKDVA